MKTYFSICRSIHHILFLLSASLIFVRINYGEQGLLLPDAIALKSNLLYVKDKGLIAEWGIRIKQKTEEEHNGKTAREAFLELNTYIKINEEGTEK